MGVSQGCLFILSVGLVLGLVLFAILILVLLVVLILIVHSSFPPNCIAGFPLV
jgi:hypothetical protein